MRKVVVFPAPLGTQESVDVTGMDRQIDAVDRGQIAVALDQAPCLDRRLLRRRFALSKNSHYDTDST